MIPPGGELASYAIVRARRRGLALADSTHVGPPLGGSGNDESSQLPPRRILVVIDNRAPIVACAHAVIGNPRDLTGGPRA